jgi:hypothetical protein
MSAPVLKPTLEPHPNLVRSTPADVGEPICHVGYGPKSRRSYDVHTSTSNVKRPVESLTPQPDKSS